MSENPSIEVKNDIPGEEKLELNEITRNAEQHRLSETKEIKSNVLIQLGEKLSSSRTREEAAKVILDAADEIYGFDACVLDFYSEEKDRTYTVVKFDTVEGKRIDFPPNKNGEEPSKILRKVIKEGAQLILRKSTDELSDSLNLFGNTNKRSLSLMIAPIICKGTSIKGIISIQSYTKNAYTQKDLDTFQSLANYSAGAFERIQFEEELKESEEKYRTVASTAIDAIITVNEENIIVYANPAVKYIFGFSEDELIGQNLQMLIPGNIWELHQKNYSELLRGGYFERSLSALPVEGKHNNGKPLPLEVSFGKFHSKDNFNFTLIIRDVSERKKIEEQVEKSLLEKETLLREIHHRVKNNMQIVSSLLNLQSQSIKDEKVLEIFQESRNRITAMALIHEKLYEERNLSQVNFPEYLNNLTEYLIHAYKQNMSYIKLVLDIKEKKISLDLAISLGLIINELVTNSLKHAFKEQEHGELHILLKKEKKNYLLKIKDDGKGIPEDIDYLKTESLGLKLVVNLVEQQGGKIELNKNNGTEFIIKIPE
jgi:PAS domain S-box-containing protein